jgi:hypothetical protein
MRTTNILWLGAVATLALSTQAEAACNIRGEHCGRPAWAANAFSGPYGRAPESALTNPTHQAPKVYYHTPHHSRVERSERVVVKKAPREKIARHVEPEIVVKKAAPERIVETVAPEKTAKVVPLVKFADGQGRQFDPASKVWFDGKSQCWHGPKQFTFKNGDWFYGKTDWLEVNGSWRAVSGDAPELVSCESVPLFAAKATKAVQASKLDKAENAAGQPASGTSGPAKIKTAEGDTSAPAQKPAAPASSECKKYFPSVGQLVAVPCTE